ncbi:sensor histidine kinase [Sorangium sp. So ce1335]|uniref:sensor histidine kinase n=1 Tax=Sorangium sp. So ce1335 TaxID=3133335 RepID=UPI003F6227A0
MSQARRFLRSVWSEPRAPRSPRRTRMDCVLVAAFAVIGSLEAAFRSDLPWRTASLIVGVGLLPTLLWRRTRPLLMVVIAFGLVTVVKIAALFAGSGSPGLHAMAYMLLLPYALFRWGTGREAALGLPVIAAAASFELIINRAGIGDIVGGSAVLLSCMALGAAARYRARVRLRELDEAKLAERERLARDLHDTVAHHVSAIAIRAQAGLAAASARPEAPVDALRVIADEASRALGEMRTMVRLLRRDEPAGLAPSPRVSDIERLASQSAAGPPVEVKLTGDFDDVPSSISAAIFRLAQESITNARRHARQATRIEVEVTADSASVRLRVTDDGRVVRARHSESMGYGLIGMTERAELLGGTCHAGPGPERGWTVTAVLPRNGRST